MHGAGELADGGEDVAPAVSCGAAEVHLQHGVPAVGQELRLRTAPGVMRPRPAVDREHERQVPQERRRAGWVAMQLESVPGGERDGLHRGEMRGVQVRVRPEQPTAVPGGVVVQPRLRLPIVDEGRDPAGPGEVRAQRAEHPVGERGERRVDLGEVRIDHLDVGAGSREAGARTSPSAIDEREAGAPGASMPMMSRLRPERRPARSPGALAVHAHQLQVIASGRLRSRPSRRGGALHLDPQGRLTTGAQQRAPLAGVGSIANSLPRRP